MSQRAQQRKTTTAKTATTMKPATIKSTTKPTTMKPATVKPATIKEVAELAKVSIKTVSRVMNDEGNVSPATRDVVLTAAQRLNYRPNMAARRLASRRSFMICLLYDKAASDYMVEVQFGVLERCDADHYSLLIRPCGEMSTRQIKQTLEQIIQQSNADGFILGPPLADNKSIINLLQQRGVPFVRISQAPKKAKQPCVGVEDTQAAHRLVSRLIEKGHRRIGMIRGNPKHGSATDRLNGYRRALLEHDIPIRDEWIVGGSYEFEDGVAGAEQLLALPKRRRPTAIFASNDHMALGVLQYAGASGIEVPEELAVCGFDDIEFARFVWPGLTTVNQPIRGVARTAADLLIRQLKGEYLEGVSIRLPAAVVERESTGPLEP